MKYFTALKVRLLRAYHTLNDSEWWVQEGSVIYFKRLGHEWWITGKFVRWIYPVQNVLYIKNANTIVRKKMQLLMSKHIKCDHICILSVCKIWFWIFKTSIIYTSILYYFDTIVIYVDVLSHMAIPHMSIAHTMAYTKMLLRIIVDHEIV